MRTEEEVRDEMERLKAIVKQLINYPLFQDMPLDEFTKGLYFGGFMALTWALSDNKETKGDKDD